MLYKTLRNEELLFNPLRYLFVSFQLYDGPDVQSNLIGTFCGQSLPPAGATTGTSLHVVFYSDGLNARSGFQMLWHVNGELSRFPLNRCVCFFPAQVMESQLVPACVI